MKAFLLHGDRDADLEPDLPANAQALSQDLELNTLFTVMAAGDPFLLEVSRRTLLSSLLDREAIIYRQQILIDSLENPSVVRDLYALAGETLQADKRVWEASSKTHPVPD